jgi:ceramide glucosyltransferase
MFSEVVLAAWSAAGVAWWIVAWWLVRGERRKKVLPPAEVSVRSLTIFKPLPPLGARGLEAVSSGIESFIAQLDSESEMLLGAHEADRLVIAPFIEAMRAKYPKGQVRTIFRSQPDPVANPKVAWQIYLAPHARGELWLWSDADIVAPPRFAQRARAEFAQCGAGMVTFPYVMRKVPRSSALYEALFVNAEIYPGVLLLRRFGPVDFGLGAGMIFERDEFRKRVDWNELGGFLADDFQLGQRLRPVRVAEVALETVAGERTWPEALRHDLRWTKTIRWNRPLGFFARVLVLPVMGWLIAVGLHPLSIFVWAGLAGMIQADVLAAAAICGEIGYRVKGRNLVMLECWSLWRLAAWVLAWIPGRVTWSGRDWSGAEAPNAEFTLTTPLAEPIDNP